MAGFVYLVRNGDLHKIGRTDNLERRLKQLKPDAVVQTLKTNRSRDLEYEMHQRFKHKRLPQSEYFRLSQAEVVQARKMLGWSPPGPSSPKPTSDSNIYRARKKKKELSISLIQLLAELFLLVSLLFIVSLAQTSVMPLAGQIPAREPYWALILLGIGAFVAHKLKAYLSENLYIGSLLVTFFELLFIGLLGVNDYLGLEPTQALVAFVRWIIWLVVAPFSVWLSLGSSGYRFIDEEDEE